jgi:hypothetical protein
MTSKPLPMREILNRDIDMQIGLYMFFIYLDIKLGELAFFFPIFLVLSKVLLKTKRQRNDLYNCERYILFLVMVPFGYNNNHVNHKRRRTHTNDLSITGTTIE